MLTRVAMLALLLVAIAGPAEAEPQTTADLTLTASVNAVDPHVGGYVVFRVRARNLGPDTVDDVRCTTTVTPALSFAPGGPGGCFASGLQPGHTSVVVTVYANVVAAGSPSATISVYGIGNSDPNPANDTVVVHVKTLPPARTYVELRDPAPAPTGTRIAYVRWEQYGRRDPYPQPATRGQIAIDGKTVTPLQPVPSGIAWAPDGQRLAYASGGHIWAVDLNTHRVWRVTTGVPALDRTPAWSPDGTRIAYRTGDRFGLEPIVTIPASGGVQPTIVNGVCTSQPTPSWWVFDGALDIAPDGSCYGFGPLGVSRDGSRVLERDPQSRWFYVLDTTTGARVGNARPVQHPKFSPLGTAVGGVLQGGDVVLEPLGQPRLVAPHSDSANDSARFTASGSLAYVASGPCGPRSQIDVLAPNGAVRVAARACTR